MPFVSATRLHLRSKLYYLSFMIYSLRAARQAQRSRGFKGGVLAGDAQNGAWTITVWNSEADMRAYRNAGVHGAAMRKLLQWCDEASFAHWTTDLAALPSMDEAHQRLSAAGRTSKVHHPSPAHAAGRTTSQGIPRVGLNLRPRRTDNVTG